MSEEDELLYSYEELEDLVIKYQNISISLQQENKELNKKYENAVSDYEQEHYKVVKAIEYIKKYSFEVSDMEEPPSFELNVVEIKELLEILGDKENE